MEMVIFCTCIEVPRSQSVLLVWPSKILRFLRAQDPAVSKSTMYWRIASVGESYARTEVGFGPDVEKCNMWHHIINLKIINVKWVGMYWYMI